MRQSQRKIAQNGEGKEDEGKMDDDKKRMRIEVKGKQSREAPSEIPVSIHYNSIVTGSE